MIKHKAKINRYFSDDFVEGLKAGLKIARDVAKRHGYKMTFPSVEDMIVKTIDEKENKIKEGKE